MGERGKGRKGEGDGSAVSQPGELPLHASQRAAGSCARRVELWLTELGSSRARFRLGTPNAGPGNPIALVQLACWDTAAPLSPPPQPEPGVRRSSRAHAACRMPHARARGSACRAALRPAGWRGRELRPPSARPCDCRAVSAANMVAAPGVLYRAGEGELRTPGQGVVD